MLFLSSTWSDLMETMERDAEYIASQCKYIRKMFSLTQENLADASGLTVRTIQKVESGLHGAYNTVRPHSSLGYQSPAVFAADCVLPASAMPQPPEHSHIN